MHMEIHSPAQQQLWQLLEQLLAQLLHGGWGWVLRPPQVSLEQQLLQQVGLRLLQRELETWGQELG